MRADSNNKHKTIWNIVKSETNKISYNKSVQSIYINCDLTDNPIVISDTFNNYFLSTADNIILNNNNINTNSNIKDKNNKVINYSNPIDSISCFQGSIPKYTVDCSSTKETEKIIKSLKSKN